MKAKKEVTLAVIIGLFLAVLITGGILRARSALKTIQNNPGTTTSNSKSNAEKNPSNNLLFIELETEDNLVTTEDTLTVAGKTLPQTYIAITGEKSEYLIVPSDIGSFSQEVVLVKGANLIKVIVYRESGEKIEKSLSVVYTTAEI